MCIYDCMYRSKPGLEDNGSVRPEKVLCSLRLFFHALALTMSKKNSCLRLTKELTNRNVYPLTMYGRAPSNRNLGVYYFFGCFL